jgi:hypothetical protein
MELGVKTVIGGAALFVLGGLSVYFLVSPTADADAPVAAPITTSPATESPVATQSTTTPESFYEAADARREQLLADKAEADRLAKLKSVKERSVECKFWKQQQKTSSAAAKIDAKIDEHCNLPSSSAASESSSAADTTL